MSATTPGGGRPGSTRDALDGGSHPAGAGAAAHDGPPQEEGPRTAPPEPSRGSFAMAAAVTGFALFLTYGLVVMDPEESAEGGPGPEFFPVIVLVLAWVVAVGLVVDAVRERRAAHRRLADAGPRPAGAPTDDAAAGSAGLATTVAADQSTADRDTADRGTADRGTADRGTAQREPDLPVAPTDWRAMVLVAVTFAIFIAVLVPLGWLLAGTWLFWGTAQSLGSRRRLFDVGVALAVAAVVQLAFSAGLGLNLPAGVLAL
ncbi:tripartite tricarboxylate transporter TctB family protein [Pseudokineococcus basanitobsidens]|uniref:Tripartite tricarboxylate transporter TctB family protein n=1 Tax=Pseudokineococcus basanitobsidens TaxID=1926649 RepID=A0ABU8RLZ1_9ACTN